MSALKIYNTLARDKVAFVPLEPGKVKMYVCESTFVERKPEPVL